MSMELWYTEQEQDHLKVSFRTDNVLFRGKSEFQTVDVIETRAYGRMLVLDGFVMCTDTDEFVYHEMIAHIPACIHKDPKRVVVIGGGDGGTVRELLKHPGIEEIVLCEIDGMVIDACRKFFPRIASGLDDPRVKVRVADGLAYVKGLENEVDILIVDSTDPIGPGEGLFTGEFYKNVARALRPGGVMAAQSESPWYKKEFLERIHRNISSGFKHKRSYIGSIPTYPRGLWSWTMAANHDFDPAAFDQKRFASLESSLQYLTKERMTGAFDLPPFFRRKLE